VALQLRKKGISRVRPLAGGFFGWRDKGYPLAELTSLVNVVTTSSGQS
jgi:rhodanese-related sulfurtransferase